MMLRKDKYMYKLEICNRKTRQSGKDGRDDTTSLLGSALRIRQGWLKI